MERKAFSVKEAAAMLGVHPVTLRRMIDRGELYAVKLSNGPTGRGGALRIPASAIDQMLSAP